MVVAVEVVVVELLDDEDVPGCIEEVLASSSRSAEGGARGMLLVSRLINALSSDLPCRRVGVRDCWSYRFCLANPWQKASQSNCGYSAAAAALPPMRD